MPGPLRISDRWEIPEAEVTWRFSRSGGPGGQSVNTSDSRAELSFDIGASATIPSYIRARLLERLAGRLVDGVITVAASDARSQHQNRLNAEQRLATLLREASAPPAPARRPTKPKRSAQEERLDTKRRRGETKRLRRSTDD